MPSVVATPATPGKASVAAAPDTQAKQKPTRKSELLKRSRAGDRVVAGADDESGANDKENADQGRNQEPRKRRVHWDATAH